jgi:hypothetical protein
MNRSCALICAAACTIAAAAPAYADRDGDGPVRTSRIVKTTHTEFTLPGSGWAQVVGALAGTPTLGDYGIELGLIGGPCQVRVAVDTKTQGTYPRVGRHSVRLHPPFTQPLLSFTHSGRHGAVRWWAGTSDQLDAAGAAVQRTPAALRSKHRRYLLTWVSVSHIAVSPAADTDCKARARNTGARAVLRILRTLTLADGPVVPEPPFVTA